MNKLLIIATLLISGSLYASPSANYFGEEDTTETVTEDPAPRVIYHPSTHKLYSYKLCEEGKYHCIKVKRGKNWHNLFPDEKQRDIVKRLNRTNTVLKVGQPLAIPDNLASVNLLTLAPFEQTIDTHGKKLIVVSLPKLAFGAYDESGKLVYWGPVSGGRDVCPEGNASCNTTGGIFNIFQKKGEQCFSRSFPIDHGGGAPMPYCMFFLTGFALHGSNNVPGYNDSHGCVRMYSEDAKWLNKNFVDVPQTETDFGTEVIVQTAENEQTQISDDQTETIN